MQTAELYRNRQADKDSSLASTLRKDSNQELGPLNPIPSLNAETKELSNILLVSVPEIQDLEIRTLNSDNRKDVTSLISLFRSHYGSSHAIAQVFDPLFWTLNNRHSRRKSPIISIVAAKDKRFFAHLAYQIDFTSGTAQLLLPAIDPEYRRSLFSIIRLFWSRIRETGERQGWRAVVTYSPSSEPLQQLLAAKCFGAETSALLPCKQREKEDAPGTIISMISPLEVGHMARLPVFIPEHRREFAAKLFESFGTPREFYTAGDRLPAFFSPAASKPISLFPLSTWNTQLIRMRPSQVGTAAECWKRISSLQDLFSQKGTVAVFELSAQDPLSEEIALRLEDSGFSLSGISPLAMPDDALVYCRAEPRALCRTALYTPLAREIRALICNGQNVQENEETHILELNSICESAYEKQIPNFPNA